MANTNKSADGFMEVTSLEAWVGLGMTVRVNSWPRISKVILNLVKKIKRYRTLNVVEDSLQLLPINFRVVE